MINAVTAVTAVTAVSAGTAPNPVKLEALSHRAGSLRQELLRAGKSGAPAGETVDQVTQQLREVQAQIERVVLAMQLARLGPVQPPGGSATNPAAAPAATPSTDAAHAKAGGAAPERPASPARPDAVHAAPTAPARAGPDPYRPAAPAGHVLDLRS